MKEHLWPRGEVRFTRPQCMVRMAWAERYALPQAMLNKALPDSMLRQLSLCLDDDARKVLLGIKD